MSFSVPARSIATALLALFALAGIADLAAAHGTSAGAQAASARVLATSVVPDCAACGVGF